MSEIQKFADIAQEALSAARRQKGKDQ